MESRHLVSVSRIVSRPIFASLGFEGCRSRSQAYCLETLNIARIWLSKTVIQRVFFSILIAGKKQWKQVGKMGEIRKKLNLGRYNDIFFKFWQNPQILKSKVSVSEFLMESRSLISSLESRSRRLWFGLRHCCLVLPMQKKYNWKWSVKYFMLRIRLNKISLFRMLLKRINYTELQQSFDSVARNFSYTQACKITPSDNTVREHQCGKKSREGWSDCARFVLQNIYEILPNYKWYFTNNKDKILTKFCKISSLNDLL